MHLVTLPKMKRKIALKPAERPVCTGKARETLSANLRNWRNTLEPKAVTMIAKKSGVSVKTIYNMLNAEYDPIGPTEAVAQVYGREAWMLLCPTPLPELAEILRVYNQADDQGKRDIQFAIDIIGRRSPGGK